MVRGNGGRGNVPPATSNRDHAVAARMTNTSDGSGKGDLVLEMEKLTGSRPERQRDAA